MDLGLLERLLDRLVECFREGDGLLFRFEGTGDLERDFLAFLGGDLLELFRGDGDLVDLRYLDGDEWRGETEYFLEYIWPFVAPLVGDLEATMGGMGAVGAVGGGGVAGGGGGGGENSAALGGVAGGGGGGRAGDEDGDGGGAPGRGGDEDDDGGGASGRGG